MASTTPPPPPDSPRGPAFNFPEQARLPIPGNAEIAVWIVVRASPNLPLCVNPSASAREAADVSMRNCSR